MPALVIAWSSTTRTRTGRVGSLRIVRRLGRRRDPRADPGAPSGCRLELERAARAAARARPSRPDRDHAPRLPSTTCARSNPAPSSWTSRLTPVGAYTSPTLTEVARAWRIAFVSASWAIRNNVWATSGSGTTGVPAVTSRASSAPVRFAHAISSSSASSSERPSSGDGASPSTLRLVSSKTASAAARASASAASRLVGTSLRDRSAGPRGAASAPTRGPVRRCRAPRAPCGCARPRRPRPGPPIPPPHAGGRS